MRAVITARKRTHLPLSTSLFRHTNLHIKTFNIYHGPAIGTREAHPNVNIIVARSPTLPVIGCRCDGVKQGS